MPRGPLMRKSAYPVCEEFLGCCIDTVPQPPAQSSNVHIRPLRALTVPRCENCMAVSPTVCRMFEHCPPHVIQLVLNSVHHTGMGIITQQDDAISEFTPMFFLDHAMQHCVVTELEVQKQPSIDFKEHSQHLFAVRCL